MVTRSAHVQACNVPTSTSRLRDYWSSDSLLMTNEEVISGARYIYLCYTATTITVAKCTKYNCRINVTLAIS